MQGVRSKWCGSWVVYSELDEISAFCNKKSLMKLNKNQTKGKKNSLLTLQPTNPSSLPPHPNFPSKPKLSTSSHNNMMARHSKTRVSDCSQINFTTKARRKKGKTKKKNSKQLIQFCFQTLASSLHTVTTKRQLPQAPKYEFLPHPTPSPTQKMQNQLTMARKEAQITRWVALRIARERIKDKITTTKHEEEQEFRDCAFHCVGASLAAWRAFLPPPTGRHR
jgi:hypothetical protein